MPEKHRAIVMYRDDVEKNVRYEEIESIACYGNVGSGEETGKFYCEESLA